MLLFAALLVLSQPALADFTQQGSKLVGTGATGNANQGTAIAVSADGNTAIVGGNADSSNFGAAWVYTRSGEVWSQQGNKLVGNDTLGTPYQGISVALSADGNTALVGGYFDTVGVGAVFVFVRSGNTWTQQGSKLVGTGATGNAYQGVSVALSADGNTAIVGGMQDNSGAGAVWVFTRSGVTWTQQGSKLIGTGGDSGSHQGVSVALSADGNTALVGGYLDNTPVNFIGAAWVWTRSSGVWTQQGSKLIGTGVVGGAAYQGNSVALSADGNTALIGGPEDNSQMGAAWVFTRSGVTWSQQGSKLVGTGAVGAGQQGYSVALSGDGNTAMVGGYFDDANKGATWVFTRSGGVWSQQGNKLVGTGAVGSSARQGRSLALSSDGNTALVGGLGDDSGKGAAWVYAKPQLLQQQLQVTPATEISFVGSPGGPFSATEFQYQISTTSGSFNYSIDGIPTWLNASFTSGTATTSPITNTFTLMNVSSLGSGVYTATISFTNTTNGSGNTTRTATLLVGPATACLTMAASDAEGQLSVTSDACVPLR